MPDESRTLVRGIGWTFKDRPADRASNGIALSVDGWFYQRGKPYLRASGVTLSSSLFPSRRITILTGWPIFTASRA